MRLYIYIFILLLLCIFPLDQQERSESYIRISAPVSLAGALDEIESQTNYSFIYDAQVINLSEKVRKPLSGRSVFEILNLLFQNTEIVYTVMNDQIILNKKEAIIQMQQKLDGKVKGIVTDHKGEPIACVNVVEKGTRNGTITDMDGSFVLELPEEATLVFSYIGYRSREIEYEGQLSLNVQLEDDAQILDEVVVTALGIEKKESSLPYATQLITGGELVRAKDFNFMSTLSGKMAGLQINRTSAGLGSSSRVIIRGSRSASGNNQPLYVIDGVPILSISSEQALTTIGGTADAGNRDAGDGISNLNPDDIESLSVLKGASASALYGGQAANGVILIKTKKGKAGVRNIHFSSSLTVDQAISLPKFQNEFGRMEGAETCWGDRASLPVYDPVGDFFQTGITAINSLIFTAGNSHVQNYFSYANTTARGIVPKNNLSKHNFNLRESSSFFDDRLILEGQVNLILQTIKGKPTAGGFYMNPLQGLYTFPRGMDMAPYKENFEVYNEKRNMNVQNWYTTITDFEQNPYWLVNRTENEDKRARVLALASASFKVTDGFTLQGRGNIDYVNDKYQQEIYASTSPGIAGENGRYIYYTYQTTLLYGDLMAKLNKSWDDFSLNAAIGTSITDTRTSALMLESMTKNDRHQVLLDTLIAQLIALLQRDKSRKFIAQQIVRWLESEHPLKAKILPTEWLGEHSAELVSDAVNSLLDDISRDRAHQIRHAFDRATFALIDKLKNDPEMAARADAVKSYLKEDEAFNRYLSELWGDLREWLKVDINSEDSRVKERIARAGQWFGETLIADDALRASLNGHLEQAAHRVVPEFSAFLTRHISDTVKSWDARDMSRQIELNIGKDLQFIRVNGTLVGGCIGLILYLLSQLPALFPLGNF